MIIGFIGSGAVATNLGAALTRAGHTAIIGRRTGSPSFSEAIAGAEIVILAIPYLACADVLPPLAGALAGKILVDATNPLNADYSPHAPSDGRSGAEHIAELLPGSRVVKAFNTIFADNMTAERALRHGVPQAAFIAGDDGAANAAVADLAIGAGFAPLEIRPLAVARFLEGMTHMLIANAFGMQRGTSGAFIWSAGPD